MMKILTPPATRNRIGQNLNLTDLVKEDIMENFENKYQQVLEIIKKKIIKNHTSNNNQEEIEYTKEYIDYVNNIIAKYNGNIEQLSFDDALTYLLKWCSPYYSRDIDKLYFFYKKNPEKFEQIILGIIKTTNFDFEIIGTNEQFLIITTNNGKEIQNLYNLYKDKNITFQNLEVNSFLESSIIKSISDREYGDNQLHNAMRNIKTKFDVEIFIKLLNKVDFYQLFENYVNLQRKKTDDGKRLVPVNIGGNEYIADNVFHKYSIFKINNQLIDELDIPELEELKNSPELLAYGNFQIKADSYDFRIYAEDYLTNGILDKSKISTIDDYKKFINEIKYLYLFDYHIIDLFADKKDVEVFIHNLKAYNQFDNGHPIVALTDPAYLVKTILSIDDSKGIIEITKDRLLKGRNIIQGTEKYIYDILQEILENGIPKGYEEYENRIHIKLIKAHIELKSRFKNYLNNSNLLKTHLDNPHLVDIETIGKIFEKDILPLGYILLNIDNIHKHILYNKVVNTLDSINKKNVSDFSNLVEALDGSLGTVKNEEDFLEYSFDLFVLGKVDIGNNITAEKLKDLYITELNRLLEIESNIKDITSVCHQPDFDEPDHYSYYKCPYYKIEPESLDKCDVKKLRAESRF